MTKSISEISFAKRAVTDVTDLPPMKNTYWFVNTVTTAQMPKLSYSNGGIKYV